MSTDYKIVSGKGIEPDICLLESSSRVAFFKMFFEEPDKDFEPLQLTDYLKSEDLRKAIVAQIKVLSYISSNPHEVLQRFNVDYKDER